MKKRILKKSLVIAIMLLFIGTGIVPAGNIVENDSRSLKSDNSEEILSWGKAFGLSLALPWEYRICYIELNDPQNITWFGSGPLPAFFNGGTWTNDGRWIVCEYYTGALWEIDPVNGDMESIGGGGVGFNGLSCNPTDGLLYGVSGSGLYRIDIENGEQKYVGSFGVTSLMTGIAFDFDGTLFGWSISPDTRYKINIDDGACTEVGPLGINIVGGGADGAFEFEDDILYLAAYTTDGQALYKCDEDTGNCTLVGPFPFEIDAFAIPYELEEGKTLYVGGDGTGNYTKIQDAIDNASDGDTVFVYDDSSPYYENIVVDKSINLVGEDKNTTTIDGSFKNILIKIRSSFVYINNFTLQKGKYETIQASVNKEIHISQCNLLNSDGGIYFENINNRSIEYCYFFNIDGGGIRFIPSNDIWVSHCDIDSCNNLGIALYGSNISIGYCRISNSTYSGILIGQRSKNIRVFRSIIRSNNGSGIHITESGSSGESSNITIENNQIEKNGQGNTFNAGILLSRCLHSVIIKNNNIISNNDMGLFILYSSNNTILKNNFLNNKRHAFFKNCTNTWKQNYWDRPRILPKLIFGTIKIGSIWIPWINIDWRPAKEPYDIGV